MSTNPPIRQVLTLTRPFELNAYQAHRISLGSLNLPVLGVVPFLPVKISLVHHRIFELSPLLVSRTGMDLYLQHFQACRGVPSWLRSWLLISIPIPFIVRNEVDSLRTLPFIWLLYLAISISLPGSLHLEEDGDSAWRSRFVPYP